MKLALSVKERLVLLNVLPKAGTLTELRLVRETLSAVGFTEAEHLALEFKQNEKGTAWNEDAECPFEFEMGQTVLQLILGELRKLDTGARLPMEFLDIYERLLKLEG